MSDLPLTCRCTAVFAERALEGGAAAIGPAIGILGIEDEIREVSERSSDQVRTTFRTGSGGWHTSTISMERDT